MDLERAPEELVIAYPGLPERTAEVQRGASEGQGLHLSLSAVPEEGVELRMRFDTEEEVEVRVTDRTHGLEGLPGRSAPPGDVGPWVLSDSHSTLVTRAVRI
ncbi:hypothetical protein [Nocardiopsis baichengensis]|uniref:hypothetical protein n=1 Tax=Nocardiopsis baichengensis TaxID=280240 RepID=UPI0003480CFE|nr:hypothetical protein [Nocardiopsis baichengensis]